MFSIRFVAVDYFLRAGFQCWAQAGHDKNQPLFDACFTVLTTNNRGIAPEGGEKHMEAFESRLSGVLLNPLQLSQPKSHIFSFRRF